MAIFFTKSEKRNNTEEETAVKGNNGYSGVATSCNSYSYQ
jgi:hypothetical protein